MKIVRSIMLAGLAVATVGIGAAPASARPGWHGHKHRVCHWEWRHHHRVRRCYWR